MPKRKLHCDIAIELDRPLTQDECNFLRTELDEWLFNHFQHWEEMPFGDFTISCDVVREPAARRSIPL
jgi:hypothetical protein